MYKRQVNNRPITTASDDPKDLEPLTPSHLLLSRPATIPVGMFDGNDMYARMKWRQVQYLADVFWARWTKEYLHQLRQRSKWHEEKRDLRPGDVVLIIDRQMPRNEWMMGRIIEVYKGADGHARSARIKTKINETVRPIVKLSLLEEVEERCKLSLF